MLAHHVGEVVPLDTLCEALWGDDPPKSARNVIQVRVSGLRQGLGPSLELRASSSGYVLEQNGVSVEACEFEQLIDVAAERLDDDPADALDAVDAALDIWRGDPAASGLDI